MSSTQTKASVLVGCTGCIFVTFIASEYVLLCVHSALTTQTHKRCQVSHIVVSEG